MAADYAAALIIEWFKEREWPEITRQDVYYYRSKYAPDVDAVRAARLNSALNSGLALKEERVSRLKAHADALESIKWDADKNGRLWNEKAWRETLADIAAEMGHRKQFVEVSWREALEKNGIDAGSVFEQMVRVAADAIANRSDGGGSPDRSPEADNTDIA